MTIKVTSTRRSKSDPMGRFGGGWQWKVGVQAGNLSRKRGSVIVNLLTFYVRIVWES